MSIPQGPVSVVPVQRGQRGTVPAAPRRPVREDPAAEREQQAQRRQQVSDAAQAARVAQQQRETQAWEATLVSLRANSSAVVTLDLSGKSVGERGARELAEALQHNTHLQGINFYRNELQEAGARQVTILYDDVTILCI